MLTKTPLLSTAMIAAVLHSAPAPAETLPVHVLGATALTQVFGDGQKLTAVAVEYDRPISGPDLAPSSFRVEGRTVTGAHTAPSPFVSDRAKTGPFVVIELSPSDPAASLRIEGPGGGPADKNAQDKPRQDGPGNGPPKFGPRPIMKPAVATVIQTGPVTTADGQRYDPDGTAVVTSAVRTPIVDDFRQFEFRDPNTGRTLPYNLFVPKDYDPHKTYPLVLFIHDAGVLSFDVTATLKQGLGAVAWANPDDQARHPAFVLAPQYSEVAVDDGSNSTSDLDTTVDLVRDLTTRYAIDKDRLYTTGQSMGAMMSIAMDIEHPDLFAASFIVAGQWDPAKVAPVASQKLWIMVSEGDLKAYPGENAITAALERDGAKVARAVWNGTAAPDTFAADVQGIEAQSAAINYVALRKGTVVPPSQRDDGGSNHLNTWRIGYAIPGIRDWIFAQRRHPSIQQEN